MHATSRRILGLITTITCVTFSPVLRADDVTDAIDEAVRAYNEKDYAAATQALEMAAQLVRQMRAEGMTVLLPEPPSGWTAEEAASSSAGASMFGGMVSASRDYNKGDAHVQVQYITDSPMLQTFMMMMNMPMMASSDGGKLVTIKRQKAILKYQSSDKSGSLNIVVGGRLLVQIEGNGVTEAELRAFAEAIDYDKVMAAL